MKRLIPFIFLLASVMNPLFATHNRAGEITLTQLDEFTYEIMITTFTYTLSPADRDYLEVQWGDNSYSTAPRISKIELPNYYRKNIYVTRHTYPGAGTYEVVVQDPNRNLGVKNIPNSVNVVFSIKTTITINPIIGQNSTPVLLNPPIDRAALNQVFIHNPAAYDPDGDSISYKLTVCTEEDGKPIENYTLPASSDTIYVDPVTGDLTWIKPMEIGIYNIAIDIEEWREGVKIGNIVRDMQIEVFPTNNKSPSIESLLNYCVEAGTELSFNVIATDPDFDSIYLEANGGPFIVDKNPATFTIDPNDKTIGRSKGLFSWKTDCSHVRQQSYTVVFKAEDNNSDTKLVDLKNVNIRVIGKAPPTPILFPASNSVTLTWERDSCTSVSGYRIFRKVGPAGYTPDSCIVGVPSFTGFEPIATLNSRNDTIFFDDNRGSGLEQGNEYCYMIVSIYPDGTPSLSSGEACTPLVAGLPAMLQASVVEHDSEGKIELKWARPESFDTLTGPFKYEINRYNNLFGNDLDANLFKITADKTDTLFIDSTVNTNAIYIDSTGNTNLNPYSYELTLYHSEGGNWLLINDTAALEVASTLYPDLIGKDNEIELHFRKNVPWINNEYSIYRYSEAANDFEPIGTTNESVYTDRGLKNLNEYCYKVVSKGWRTINDKYYVNENISHITCTEPYDSIPPCTPVLQVHSFCEEQYNQLTWHFSSPECLEDVTGYKLYYSPTYNGTFELIE